MSEEGEEGAREGERTAVTHVHIHVHVHVYVGYD